MEKVKEILSDLETKHKIKILYACEAGSRAWNLESEDSDFDIRFIFRYNDIKKYVSLKPLKETRDGFSEDRLYDWQGWDVRKSLRHLKEMNPSIAEWIYSPIVYYSDSDFDFRKKAQNLLENQNRILPLYYHYISMAKSNYKAHIDGKDLVKIKKYLYCIRPAGMVEWLKKNKRNKSELIEIDFQKVLIDIQHILGKEVYESILRVIDKKKQVKELDEEPRIKCIDVWLENLFKQKPNIEDLEEKNTNDSKNTNHKAEGALDNYDTILFAILNLSE